MREQTNEDPGALAGATGAECKAERLPTDDGTPVPSVKAFPAQAAWRQRNPQRVWAQASLRSGLKRGLVQQEPCEVCGDPKSEAHHDDYDRPLAVRWLCRWHHKQHHAQERAA